MQVTNDAATVGHSWLSPEEEHDVTFQIALVGRNGLVVASDRMARYEPTPDDRAKKPLPKPLLMSKYFMNGDQSLICFAAGAATAMDLGRKISEERMLIHKLGAAQSEWESALIGAASIRSIPSAGGLADEIIVVRRDVSDAFWFVLRKSGMPPKAIKMGAYVCTGASVFAQFLPHHLWSDERSISELKTLALVTLSYAAKEDPSYVGPPFDVMTLDREGNIAWSVHQPTHEHFSEGLRKLFDLEVERFSRNDS